MTSIDLPYNEDSDYNRWDQWYEWCKEHCGVMGTEWRYRNTWPSGTMTFEFADPRMATVFKLKFMQ